MTRTPVARAAAATVEMLEQRVMLSVSVTPAPSASSITEGTSISLGVAATMDGNATLDSGFWVNWGDNTGNQYYPGNWLNSNGYGPYNPAQGPGTYTTQTPPTHLYTESSGRGSFFVAAWTNETNSDNTVDQGCTLVDIQVAEAPSSASISGPGSIAQGSTYALSTNFTDPGGDAPSYWDIYWGDGASERDYTPSGPFSHVYNASVVETINATATTEDGTFSAAPMNVGVLGQPPSTPANLTAAASGPQVNLSWTASAGQMTAYEIERSTDGVNFSYVGPSAPDTTSYVDSPPAGTYWYRIYATNGGADSGFSNISAPVTLAAPAAPGNLGAAAVSASQINLTWQDNSNNESGFKIDRSTDNVNWTTLPATAANVTSYSDRGLTENTLYYHRIRATNSAGDSVNAATDAYTLPAAPTNLTAVFVSGDDINLSWTNNSAHAFANYVEQSTNGGTWTRIANLASGSTNFSAQGPFSPSTTYSFRVYAYGYGGYSGYSNSNPLTTPAFPTAPSLLTATAASASQINLTWQDNSNNESGFKIDRSPDGSTWTPLTTTAANVTSYSDTGLTEGTLYYYRVRATNSLGDSANTTTTYAYTLPAAPTALTAAFISGGEINLSWTNNSAHVIYNDVEQSLDNSTWTIVGTSANNTFDAPGPFNPLTTYYFRVRGLANGGYSGYADPASVLTPAFPTAPTSLGASASGTQVDLTWTASVGQVDSYHIERSTNGVDFTEIAGNVQSTSYTDSSVQAPGSYTYRVRAEGSGIYSAYSNTAQITYPLPPTNVVANGQGGTSLVVTWTASTTPGVTYSIYLGTTVGFPLDPSSLVVSGLASTVTQYTITNLDPAASYYPVVVAVGTGADSTWDPGGGGANGGQPATIGQDPGIGPDPSNPDPSAPGVSGSGEVFPNDDSYSPQVELGFDINFYGKHYTKLYVNNNGNITFNTGLGQYTPQSITGLNYAMIAPFWGDVDTRTPGGAGTVTYHGTTVDGHQAFEVDWTGTGYYNEHSDLKNTFSLQLVSRDDVNVGDFDIIFNYQQIQWETGDASGGHGGMGGTPAYAGYTDGSNQPGDSVQLPGSGVSGGLIGKTGQLIFPIRNVDLSIDSDNNNGTNPPDHSATEERLQDDPMQDGKEITVNDGTQSFTDFVPMPFTIGNNIDPASATVTFTYSDAGSDGNAGGCFRVYGSDGTYLASGQAYAISQLGLSSSNPTETLRVEAVTPTFEGESHAITATVLAAGIAYADTVQAAGQTFKVEQVTFGATNAASFHPVRLDPTPTDFSAHDLTGPQWEDLSHDGNTNGTDAGSIDGPVCYTRSGINGTNVTMTLHLNIYAPGANQNGTYKVKATIQAPGEGVFNFNAVAATVGTLQNGVTSQQDTVLTADLTASDFNISSVIADKTYTIKYSVSTDGGNTWSDAGQSKTTCYVTNVDPPKSWTYNNVPDSQTGAPDPDTNPLWTVLDIASRACQGQNLAAAAGGNFGPIINAIWGQFINNPAGAQNLKNGVAAHGLNGIPGPNMHYWQNVNLVNTCRNSGLDTSLIANLDGPCGGWASLLADCLRAEGINAYVYGIAPISTNYPPPNPGDIFAGFRVSSNKAQGNPDAQVDFANHAIVELTNNDGGSVYDPSYGMYYASEQAWMDGAESYFLWTNGDVVKHGIGNSDSKFTLEPV